MRKIAIGSGLTILAAAVPTQVFANPNVDTPAGVTEAGAVRVEQSAPNSDMGYKPQDKEGGLGGNFISADIKLSNDIKPATPSAQTKQPGHTNRSKRRHRPKG